MIRERSLSILVVLLVLLCNVPLAFAGACPTVVKSYNVVFRDISDPQFQDGKSIFLKLRDKNADVHGLPVPCFGCYFGDEREYQDQQRIIGILFINKIPEGFSEELARKLIDNDENARQQLLNVMASFHISDQEAPHDRVDGIYVYKKTSNLVQLYALGRHGFKKVEKPIKAYLSLKSLDAMLLNLSDVFGEGADLDTGQMSYCR